MKTRTKRSIAAAVLLAFLPLSLGSPAFGQDDPTVKAARARFQEGVAFFDKGEYENARAAFLQAYALRKHPAVLLNLAQSSLRSGHALEAARYFQQYLRESTSLSPAQRADAERGLADARQKLGRIEVTAPSGANVTVDGDGVGTAPLADPVDVEPGSHKVKAGNDELKLDVAAGQKVAAKFGSSGAAAASPVPTPPPPSNTPATTTPPANDTPATPAVPPNGEDTGAKVETKKMNLLAPPANMTPVYIGAGAAVVGVGIGIGFGVIAKASAQNSADSVASEIRKNNQPPNSIAQPCSSTVSTVVTKFGKACAALSDDNSKVDTDATIGNIGLAVGIAGAALAVGWFLFAPKRQDDSAPKDEKKADATPWKSPVVISPILGARTNGVSLSGSF
jgi:hypothetical protein